MKGDIIVRTPYQREYLSRVGRKEYYTEVTVMIMNAFYLAFIITAPNRRRRRYRKYDYCHSLKPDDKTVLLEEDEKQEMIERDKTKQSDYNILFFSQDVTFSTDSRHSTITKVHISFLF